MDGERWAANDATFQELEAWSDLTSFAHYMGAMPFPYDIEKAVAYYELAKSDAHEQGMDFNHQYYATGFLEGVYEIWNNGPPRA
jgi:hypothetical protein